MSDHDPAWWPKLSALLQQTGDERPLFVDVGANRGDFTERLLGHFAGAMVHCVEANPRLARVLERRFAGRAVRAWNRALHEAAGTVTLRVHEDDGTSSLLPRPRDARRYFHSGDRVAEEVRVAAMPLDALARETGIEHVHLLKLDTQGAELPIIRGASSLLARSAIDVVYTEFFVVPHYEGAALLHEIWAALAAHGYSMYDLFKGPHGRNGQLRFGDAIFVSPRVRATHLDSQPEEP